MYRKIPYLIVLISSVLPLAAAFFDSRVITYIPSLFAISAFIVFNLLTGLKNFNFSYKIYLISLVILSYCIFSLIRNQDIASFGSVGVFILSIVFYNMLSSNYYSLSTLVRQVSVIYVIHILYIYLELAAIISGYGYYFIDFFGSGDAAAAVAYYKNYNSAALLNYVWSEVTGIYPGLYGVNGLFLGSQGASMLAMFAIFWFSKVFKGDFFFGAFSFSRFFLVVSLFLYPFVASMTMNFVFILLFPLFLIFKNKKIKNLNIFFYLIIVTLAFGKTIFGLITYRINSADALDEYTELFTFLFFDFLQLDWFSKIFGKGKYFLHNSIEKNVMDSGVVLGAGDFGLGHILYSAGLILVIPIIVSILVITYKVFATISLSKKNR